MGEVPEYYYVRGKMAERAGRMNPRKTCMASSVRSHVGNNLLQFECFVHSVCLLWPRRVATLYSGRDLSRVIRQKLFVSKGGSGGFVSPGSGVFRLWDSL